MNVICDSVADACSSDDFNSNKCTQQQFFTKGHFPEMTLATAVYIELVNVLLVQYKL